MEKGEGLQHLIETRTQQHGSAEKIGYLPLQRMGFAKLPSKRLTSQNCQPKHVYFVFVAIIPI